jgi:hypothetical protein
MELDRRSVELDLLGKLPLWSRIIRHAVLKSAADLYTWPGWGAVESIEVAVLEEGPQPE